MLDTIILLYIICVRVFMLHIMMLHFSSVPLPSTEHISCMMCEICCIKQRGLTIMLNVQPNQPRNVLFNFLHAGDLRLAVGDTLMDPNTSHAAVVIMVLPLEWTEPSKRI